MVMETVASDAPIGSEVRPIVLWGFAVLLITFGGFGGWAVTAELAGAVVAEGTVKVFSSRKQVQTLEGGMVEEILVKNGDRVERGQILIRLNETQAKASYAINESYYDTTLATVSRLRSERDGLVEIDFPTDLLEKADSGDEAVVEILNGQISLSDVRKQSLYGQIELIHEQVGQLENEITGLTAQREAKKRQRTILQEEYSDLKALYEKGFVERTRVLALEREVARFDGEVGELDSDISRAKRQISESQIEISQLNKEFNEQVVTELRSQEDRLLDLIERKNSSAYSLHQNEIRATESGTVMGMGVHTLGAVLQPGTQLLEIVPSGDSLIIEAMISPVDIDNAVEGLDADVQFTAFSQRKTPTVTGQVSYVAADSQVDPSSGVPFYTVHISVSEEEIDNLNGQKLQPGMPATVFIRTSERSPLAYLMKPIQESMSLAWREP